MKGIAPIVIAGATPFLLLIILGLGLGLGLVSWQPPVFWTTQFGTPKSSNGVTAIYGDTNAIYAGGMAGFHPPGFYLNGTPSYLFINKFDLNGAQVWSQDFGNPNDPSNDEIKGVAAGTGGVYVIGITNGSSFVSAYDLNGNHLWSRQFGSSWNTVVTSVSTAVRGVYVGGYGPGPNSSRGSFLRTYAFNGTLEWNSFPGNGSVPGPTSIYVGSDGIFVAGSNEQLSYDSQAFLSKYDFNGSLEWVREFDGSSFTCTCVPTAASGDGANVYVVGQISGAFPGQVWDGRTDIFLRKYDLNGNIIWTVEFGAPDYSSTFPPGLSADTSGNYLLVPTDYHVFALKYDGSAHQQWMFQPSARTAHSIVSVGSSGLFFGGSVGYNAALSELDRSSSLILFQVNPPYSFGLLALLISIPIMSLLWLRRETRRRHRPANMTTRRSMKTPTDVSMIIDQRSFTIIGPS